jgi:hypothetical protein
MILFDNVLDAMVPVIETARSGLGLVFRAEVIKVYVSRRA